MSENERGSSSDTNSRSGTPLEGSSVKLSFGTKRSGLKRAFGFGDQDASRPKVQPGDELITEISGSTVTGRKETGPPLVIPLIKQNQWRNSPGTSVSSRSDTDETDRATSVSRSDSPAAPVSTIDIRQSTPEIDGKTSSNLSVDKESGGASKWGLQIMKKRKMDTIQESNQSTPTEVPSAVAPMSIDDEAVAAILKDASGVQDDTAPRVHTLPILAQNAVPGMEQYEDVVEKYRYDVSLRPEESTLEDYERVPIEQFGAALLRGMGWEKGKPVGKNPNGIIEPIVHKARPHLLGLGATPAPPLEIKQKKYIKPGEKRQPDPLATVSSPTPQDTPRNRRDRRNHSPPKDEAAQVGDTVSIVTGRYGGQHGKVVEIKERSSGTVVKVELADTREIARVWLEDVKPAAKQSNAIKSGREASNGRVVSRSNSTSSLPHERSWLRPRIRVRVVSKSLYNGRHYNQKGTIQDVFTVGECVLRLDNGNIVEGVKDRHLETCIPSVGSTVSIVQHSDRELVGQLGKLKEKDNKTERAVIQMEQSLEYHTFAYDEIAEFVE